jgi:O-antigen ligase
MSTAAAHSTAKSSAHSGPRNAAARLVSRARKSRPDLLLYGTVLLTWTIVWRIQDLVPILGKVKLLLLAEVVMVPVLFGDQNPNRQFRWISSPIVGVVFGILTVMILGLPTSLVPGMGVSFVMTSYLPLVLLFLAVSIGMRNEHDLVWFIGMFLFGAFMYCWNVFVTFRLDSSGRLANTVYYDANDFGLLLDCAIPFTLFFLRPGIKWWKRLAALWLLAFMLFLGVRGGSRGGFLGLVAILIYVLFFYRAIPARLRIGSIVAGIGLLSVFGSSQYWANIQSIIHPQNDYNMTSDVGRKQLWKRGMGYMLTHPITGVGVRAFPRAEGMLSAISKQYAERGRGLKWSVAHNSFVETAAELGVPGISLFIAMFWFCFAALVSVRPGQRGDLIITPEDAAFAQTLMVVFVAFIVTGFFVSAEYFGLLYMMAGLTVAQQAVLRRRAARARRDRLAGVSIVPSVSAPAPGTAIRRLPSGTGDVARRPTPLPWYPQGS